jgi:hypothetical protein
MKYIVPDFLRSNSSNMLQLWKKYPFKNVGENNFIPNIRIR